MKKETTFSHIDATYANDAVSKLNKLLATLNIYYSNLRGFHWGIEGPSFFTLHIQLERMYDAEVERIDEVAERILQLSGVPVRFYKDIESLSCIEQATKVSKPEEIVPQVLENLSAIIKVEREVIEFAEENDDLVTADMVSEYLAEQEKLIWMLNAFLK